MTRFLGLTCLFIQISWQSAGQSLSYKGAWGPSGVTVESQHLAGIRLNYSVSDFSLVEMPVGDEMLKQIILPGHFMHNETGAPDIPGRSYFIALPAGSRAILQILAYETDTIDGVDIIPAPAIPLDNDNKPLQYSRNPAIYNADTYYPSIPVMIAGMTRIRGVDVAVLGISPFQYNPVKQQLVVYFNIKMDIAFEGGNGLMGDEKYRSRYWDPILADLILNFGSLPPATYNRTLNKNSRTFNGCEYLIITPDGEPFQRWADTIKKFRTEQGILTHAVTISEAGGNTAAAIEAYINNAYINWDIPPDACLLLGDYGTDPANSITSQVLNDHPDDYNPYVSDNLFADITGDDLLPEVAFARITARNEAELELMISKFLDYERNPPADPAFYQHPVTALGWQTERWFQICSETVGGYFKNEQGKDPVRINAIYAGNPDTDPWSTAANTSTVLDYFGPTGQGYIPASPGTLGGWTGGTATLINNAINSGAFLLQHRDHGYTQGWGEPAYSNSSVNGLTNTNLPLVMSINCQTGKFDGSAECLAEKFHRYSYNGQGSGALGVVAPTEVSYSFVNDVYTWGFYDHLWPDFMPDFPANPPSRGLLPCFGNAAGKYHLEESTWPASSQTYKNITYKLFHFHGDAFTSLYSEVPLSLNVFHDEVLLTGLTSFIVTADSGAFIALTIGGEILGTAGATGEPVTLNIPGLQEPGQQMVVTVTLRNHLRYRETVEVVLNEGPYVILSGNPSVHDSPGNNNGNLDYGEEVMLNVSLKNVGDTSAYNVTAVVFSDDPALTLIDSVESYGTIDPGVTETIPDGFRISVTDTLPDGYEMAIGLSITDGTLSWNSSFDLVVHAPQLEEVGVETEEIAGNLNGEFDPGETAVMHISILNAGSAAADSVEAILSSTHPMIGIPDSLSFFGSISPGDTVVRSFVVSAGASISPATAIQFNLNLEDRKGLETSFSFTEIIGRMPALVLDLDPNHSSGPSIQAALDANSVQSAYSTTFPSDLAIYSSVFVCLGIYSSNHLLTGAQGQLLADYLNAGGNLYMEGGDTWAYDPVTAVHAMFGIEGLSDGSGDLSTVFGISGTCTEGLSYIYTGEENWIDRLASISPAFTALTNASPAYNTGIFYDSGSYRTIGISHEFGGLSNGASTRPQLMRIYLDFFNIPVFAEWLGVTGDWHNPSNWSNGLVPDHNTVVTIPASTVYPIQFTGGSAVCRGVKIDPGVSLILPAGVTLTIRKN